MATREFDTAYESGWIDLVSGSETLVDSTSREGARPDRGVFIAHAFTRLLTPEGEVGAEAKSKLEYLIDAFRTGEYAVHCALEREGWGDRLMSPSSALRLDIDQVGKASHLVSFPNGSPGAFLELGVRLARPGPTLLIRDAETTAEELYQMHRLATNLRAIDVPVDIFEDAAPDLETFQATTAERIIQWVGETA